MEIVFTSSANKKLFDSEKKLEKKFGRKTAREVMEIRTQLELARNLADYKLVDRSCHELAGDRKGQIAICLEHPYRLIVEPIPRVVKLDGGLDWAKTTSVSIIEVVDYHK